MTHHGDKPDPCWSKLPVYRPGGKLSAEQLNAEMADGLLRDRLLTRALHGVGVVFGYDVEMTRYGHLKVQKNCIHIGCGLALDRHGRMLYWPGGWLCFDDLAGETPCEEGCYTLRVHYAERPDRGGWDPCHDGADWMHRCVVFTLGKGCEPLDPCPDNLPPDPCLPRRDFVCARTGQWPGKAFADNDLEYACAEPPDLDQSDCGRFGYDRAAGLALVCAPVCDLDRDKDHCPPRFGFCLCPDREAPKQAKPAQEERAREAGDPSIRRPTQSVAAQRPGPLAERPEDEKDRWPKDQDGCEPFRPDCRDPRPCDLRQVAYRAPVLYEILNDMDVRLPGVAGYSWSGSALGPWDLRMPLAEFKARTEACMTDCDGETGDSLGLPLADGFAVAFTRPVRADTLHPMSVWMDVWLRENEIDPYCDDSQAQVVNWERQRVPAAIVPLRVDRHGLAQGVRICPSGSWVRLRRKYVDRCANADQHARVEITLRGQMILDACGCMLDARPPDLTCRDHCDTKTGQARPGGDWVSAFRVGPDRDYGDGKEYDQDDRAREKDRKADEVAQKRNGDTS